MFKKGHKHSENWYKAMSKPRPGHVRKAVSIAQKGRRHKPQEGFKKGHKPYAGTEKTRFSKQNPGKCPPEKLFRTHGLSSSRFYSIWKAVGQRCNNKNNKQYKDYGGRGIRVEWTTFEEFRDDLYESYQGHLNKYGALNTTIERIDNNGNYSKSNCRWATRAEQMMNTRRNRLLTVEI